MKLAHLDRCLHLASLLQSQSGLNATQLANQLGVCVRTVQRDLRLLKKAGWPVGAAVQGHAAKPDTSAVHLTQDELVVMLWAACVSPLAATSGYGETIRQTTENMLAQAPEHVRQTLDGLLKGSVAASRSPEDERRFLQILEGIPRKQAMRITIRDAQGLVHTRLIPTGVLVETKHVIGHSSHHRRICQFPLSQIEIVPQ